MNGIALPIAHTLSYPGINIWRFTLWSQWFVYFSSRTRCPDHLPSLVLTHVSTWKQSCFSSPSKLETFPLQIISQRPRSSSKSQCRWRCCWIHFEKLRFLPSQPKYHWVFATQWQDVAYVLWVSEQQKLEGRHPERWLQTKLIWQVSWKWMALHLQSHTHSLILLQNMGIEWNRHLPLYSVIAMVCPFQPRH